MLTALDADVIKTYVELGMGVGHHRADGLRSGQGHGVRDARRRVTCSRRRRRGSRCAAACSCAATCTQFIALFAPQYSRAAVDAALAGNAVEAEI